MDLNSIAHRLGGYLEAVACLKDDGTHFRCMALGGLDPAAALPEAARALGCTPEDFTLEVPAPVSPYRDFPQSLSDWMLHRIRPLDEANTATLDPRLADGLHEEMLDLLGAVPRWFQASRTPQASVASLVLGAIFSLYVFGNDRGAFVLLCSWDS